MPNRLWEKAQSLLVEGGDVLLIDSVELFQISALTVIPQMVISLRHHNNFTPENGLDEIVVKQADAGCELIFREIQQRLESLRETGWERFQRLEETMGD